MLSADSLKLKSELLRKLIHIGCSIFPVLYLYYLNREQIIVICVIITVLFGIAELLRYKTQSGAALFKKIFDSLLRSGEKEQNLTGATYLFLSVTVTFLVFEKHIAIPAVLILTVADSFAAIVGKVYGKHNILNKTWEGSVTFFIISFILLNLFFPGYIMYMLVVAFIVSVVELLPIPPGDNVWITLSAGLMLTFVV